MVAADPRATIERAADPGGRGAVDGALLLLAGALLLIPGFVTDVARSPAASMPPIRAVVRALSCSRRVLRQVDDWCAPASTRADPPLVSPSPPEQRQPHAAPTPLSARARRLISSGAAPRPGASSSGATGQSTRRPSRRRRRRDHSARRSGEAGRRPRARPATSSPAMSRARARCCTTANRRSGSRRPTPATSQSVAPAPSAEQVGRAFGHDGGSRAGRQRLDEQVRRPSATASFSSTMRTGASRRRERRAAGGRHPRDAGPRPRRDRGARRARRRQLRPAQHRDRARRAGTGSSDARRAAVRSSFTSCHASPGGVGRIGRGEDPRRTATTAARTRDGARAAGGTR